MTAQTGFKYEELLLSWSDVVTVLKTYNPATHEWDPILVGVPGIEVGPPPPPESGEILWADTSEDGTVGIPGPAGPPGAGVPAGGTNGQQIIKSGATTVWQNKGQFDVRDYGATGDGVADETTNIKNALADCAAKGGGEVHFPVGTYRIAEAIVVPNSVSIWGVGGGWAKLIGSTTPMTTFRCTTAVAKFIVQGSGGLFGNFSIDGCNVANGPLLHRNNVAAKRVFMSIFMARSKVEAWRIDYAQNDVHIDMHMHWNDGIGLILDKGAGGLSFYGCEFAGCANWHLVVDETAGDGPYSAPSHNTFDHCLFEISNDQGSVSTVQGCIWIKTGKRTVFRDCAANPLIAPVVGVIKVDGTGMGSDPIVVLDGFWLASAAAGATGLIQEAGSITLMGNTEFTGFLNAWRFNGGTATVDGSLTYTGVTNRWDPASTGDYRQNIIANHHRPIGVKTEVNDYYAFRTSQYGDTGSRLDIGIGGVLNFGSGTGATDTTISRASANRLHVSGVLRAGGALEAATYMDFTTEQSPDPAAPAANGARLFTKDNGSGKTQLCVRFATGAVGIIATEP
jgi:hypothetical protein